MDEISVDSAGRLTQWRGPCGTPIVSVLWDGHRLVQAEIAAPSGQKWLVRPFVDEDAVLGSVHGVYSPDGELLTRFTAISLEDPNWIPAMDRPGRLETGVGTAILGWIAHQARLRGTPSLRYRGPYPTGSLFDALMECFEVEDKQTAFSEFVDGVEQSSMRGQLQEPAVDFRPHPFSRIRPAPGVCVQLRQVPERAWVRGVSFSSVDDVRRLIRQENEWCAELVLAESTWGQPILRIDSSGKVIDGPVSPKPPPGDLFGPLPPSIRQVLVDTLPGQAPELIRGPLTSVLQKADIRWGDPGVRAAVVRGESIVIHAGLLAHLAKLQRSAVLGHLARVIAPPARQLATQKLELAMSKLQGRLQRP